MLAFLALAVLAAGPSRTPTPVVPEQVFTVTMRRADDAAVKGDLLNVDLYLMATGFPGHEKQEVHLTAGRVFRCTEITGTFFSSEEWTDKRDLTFQINPNARLITVETRSGSDKTLWRFEYVKDGNSYGLTEASMVSSGYDTATKRLTSTEWTAIKGQNHTIPWPCPMAISPIWRPY